MSTEVSGNELDRMLDLERMKHEPLHPDLEGWVEEGEWGPMLRHPLVYSIPLFLPGHANQAYLRKKELVAEAIEAEEWHSVVFLHERAYRLWALIETVTGRDDEGDVIPLRCLSNRADYADICALVADVWVDSENIEQNIGDWRALLGNGEGIWLGTDEERAEFDALPRVDMTGPTGEQEPHIHAWRGGSVGDWSWTTDREVAEFFSRRSGLPVRGHKIPVSDVFGYLTRRSEAELLVKFTDFRSRLVYPNGVPVSRNDKGVE